MFGKKRNRRKNIKRKSRISWPPIAGAIMMLATLALCYSLIADNNKDLIRQIREQQSELDRLHKEYIREEVRWNAMKSAEKLDAAMDEHAIRMELPRPDQVVRMDSDGVPFKNQASVAYLRKLLPEDVAETEPGDGSPSAVNRETRQ
jgi:hypothetical protein